MQLRTHVSNGDLVEAGELLGRFLPPKKLKTGLIASDMDGTMFDADLGVLVFLEKLLKPEFWHFSPERFDFLLLPKEYRKALAEGSNGEVEELDSAQCQLVLRLHRDIVNLYKLQKKVVHEKGSLKISDPAVNEFARKMIELDAIIVKMDGYLSKRFNGDLLLRTRFFAGTNGKHVRDLTRRVMQRGRKAVDRIVTLQVHPENRDEADQTITGEELPAIDRDRHVAPVKDVQRLLDDFARQHAHICVVTTQIQPIADTAVHHSPFKSAVNGGIIASTLGTTRRGGQEVYHPRLSELPVYQHRKAEVALEIARESRRHLAAALGDSPGNDGPMGEAALRKGGVFIIVGAYESQHRKFNPIYKAGRDAGADDIGDRMWYVDLPKA